MKPRNLLMIPVWALFLVTGVQAQHFAFESPILVYGTPKPLRSDDLKRTYGEAAVRRVDNQTWVVDKRLTLIVVYDFFTYTENAQGDLMEMTGYVMGSCDKALDSFLKASLPMQHGAKGRPLAASMSGFGFKVESDSEPGGMPHYGGQTLNLIFDRVDSRSPCNFNYTLRRKHG